MEPLIGDVGENAAQINLKLRPKTAVAFQATTILWKPSALQTTQNMRVYWIGFMANSISTPSRWIRSTGDSRLSNAGVQKPKNLKWLETASVWKFSTYARLSKSPPSSTPVRELNKETTSQKLATKSSRRFLGTVEPKEFYLSSPGGSGARRNHPRSCCSQKSALCCAASSWA